MQKCVFFKCLSGVFKFVHLYVQVELSSAAAAACSFGVPQLNAFVSPVRMRIPCKHKRIVFNVIPHHAMSNHITS